MPRKAAKQLHISAQSELVLFVLNVKIKLLFDRKCSTICVETKKIQKNPELNTTAL